MMNFTCKYLFFLLCIVICTPSLQSAITVYSIYDRPPSNYFLDSIETGNFHEGRTHLQTHFDYIIPTWVDSLYADYFHFYGIEMYRGAVLTRPPGFTDSRWSSTFVVGDTVATLEPGALIGAEMGSNYLWQGGVRTIAASPHGVTLDNSYVGEYYAELITNQHSRPQYIGFYDVIEGQRYYGWMQVSDHGVYTIAIEQTPNLPVRAGWTVSVPEPGTASASCLAGLTFLRRRRREQE